MKPQLEILIPCPATKDGRQCERGRHDDDSHYYTIWSHKNQYGSYPRDFVSWEGAS